ncbi:MAG: hypothetical protein Q7R96_05290 [Nanoarchaeota archaeon]|nr:hypothetical protein [Nanoarchaeota archaeon]
MGKRGMDFPIARGEQRNISRYLYEDIQVAQKFGKIVWKEFGNFIRALVLFGSSVKDPGNPKRDLDVLIIVDDLRFKFTKELVEAYRIVIARAMQDVDPKRLHVQSMKLTAWWEYVRAGDPVAVNMLRYGVAIVDTGFFDPLQALLEQGRIRPTDESVWTYFTLAPAALSRSKEHMLGAVIDLYWAAIDATHAALMTLGEIPPNPDHVAEWLEHRLVGQNHIKSKHAATMRELYKLFKGIVHRDVKDVSGKHYDDLKVKTNDLVNAMKEFIEKYKK